MKALLLYLACLLPVQQTFISRIFDTDEFLDPGVEVRGASQGFAVLDSLGFFFHDKGQVLIVDLDSRKLLSTFVVPGLEEAHCNNACFSDEKYGEDSVFPLLYVTECTGNNRCYVVDLNLATGRIVQEIWYDGDDYNKTFDWCIDPGRGFIYTRGGNRFYWKDPPDDPVYGRWMMIKKFRLPRKSDFKSSGQVHLALADALDSFALDDVYFGQGSVIRDGIMYTGEGSPSRCRCRIHIINLDAHTRIAVHDVSYLGLEPEGFGQRDGQILVTFHTPGNPRHNILYKLNQNTTTK
ncbi:MAG: hypothetical protein LKK08_01150 [Bacteroidales bacterium]|jgi:hypothetical protein|nr:hypothetical protein [Bacteroidales bacterium]MCI2144849.1 hypothetical protein [Bacteroidales bacterium]